MPDTLPAFTVLLAVMAATALFCRWAGFAIMRFIPATPRIEAALRATPLAVMAGIAALAAQSGGLAEGIALAGVIALAHLIGNDVIAALCGVAIVAALRWWGAG